MSGTYNIQIRNNSGVPQTYAIIAVPPQITGAMDGYVWSTVFAVEEGPQESTVTFNIPQDWLALSGIFGSFPEPGTMTTITGDIPVSLGQRNNDGSITLGTTLAFPNQDQGGWNPMIESRPKTSNGQVGAFELLTKPEFTVQEAQNGNWFVGIGKANNPTSSPTAVFIPAPGQQYQISPIDRYFVVTGNYQPGMLVDSSQPLFNSVLVDLVSSYYSNTVTINNTPEGQLVIQQDQ